MFGRVAQRGDRKPIAQTRRVTPVRSGASVGFSREAEALIS
jgi:hypothetical protein